MVAVNKASAIDELLQLLVGRPAARVWPGWARPSWSGSRSAPPVSATAWPCRTARKAGVTDLVMAMGKTAQPIDFDSVDRKGVSVVVLLASPLDKTGPHIRALAGIAVCSRSNHFAWPSIRPKMPRPS